jgi:hypothetical protein
MEYKEDRTQIFKWKWIIRLANNRLTPGSKLAISQDRDKTSHHSPVLTEEALMIKSSKIKDPRYSTLVKSIPKITLLHHNQ